MDSIISFQYKNYGQRPGSSFTSKHFDANSISLFYNTAMLAAVDVMGTPQIIGASWYLLVVNWRCTDSLVPSESP